MVTDCACREYCTKVRAEAINIFYGTAFTLILASRYAIGCVSRTVVRIVYAAEYTRYWHAIQPFFALSLPLLDFLAREIEGCAKGECRDRSKGHRVSPDRSILSRFVPLFSSLFAFQLTLLFFYRFFFVFFCHMCHRGRCLRTCRIDHISFRLGGTCHFVFFFFSANFSDGKIFASDCFFSLTCSACVKD